MKSALAAGLCALVSVAAAGQARADALSECIAAHEKGQSEFRAAQLIAAKESLIRCIERCPGEIALDCSALLPQVEASTPSLVPAATDEKGVDVMSARVVIDERIVLDRLNGVAVPLDPGEHHLRIEWPNGERAEQSVVLGEGEKNRRVVFAIAASRDPGAAVDREPTSAGGARDGRRTAAYVLAAASAGFLATFVVAAIAGKQKQNDLERCKPYCTQEQADAMHTRYLIADISLGLGLATGGVASYLYLSSGNSSAPANGAGWRAPDRFIVGIQHSF